MHTNDPVVIVSARRTPMGGLQGELSSLSANQLGAVAIEAAMQELELPADAVQEVFMGCVLPAGQGQAPARQASLGAGLPLAAGCTTVNKMCGSGMKAIMLAHDLLLAGPNRVIIAGGMESMSNAPYLLPKARTGYRLGHGQVIDHMFLDGLEDAYDKGRLMGTYAEDCAAHYQFSRDQQDEFAIQSLTRAMHAIDHHCFDAEVAPVTLRERGGERQVVHDEQPHKANLERIPHLRPAFREGGTVTPANSSSISDGAAALVMMRLSEAERRGLTPLAQLLGHATHAQEPAWFSTAPIYAIRHLLDRIGWSTDDVGLYEINEAFAVVTMAAMKDLDLADDQVNIHGGACALGHPIGCSGARITVTLLHAMRRHRVRRGVAALCIGGGEATAIALETF